MEINNIKSWCIALDTQIPNIEQYEKTLYKFFISIGNKKDSYNSMMTGCYKQYSIKNLTFKFIARHIKLKLLLSILIGILNAVFLLKSSSFSITGDIQHILILILVNILVMFIIINGIYFGIKTLSFKNITKKLEALESELKPLMQTVPTNYRNTDKITAITKIYFTRPNIDPSIILSCVDELINKPEVSRVYNKSKYMSVMFDLPCECPFLGVSDSNSTNTSTNISIDEDGKIKQRSPYLPSDIDTKVIAGSEDSDKDLQEMIGLDDVKQQIERLKTRISFYGSNVNNGNHMAFLGSAGTGKTSVARIVTKIMYDLGYIKKNQYIEISGDYLCAGDTNRASAIIEYSYGGVLFIDEAYLMYRTGSEVIGVLLKAMEDHRKDFICILAGYEEQMTKLFASNEGFSSRVKHTIYFADYSENEMLDIFNYFIKNYNNKSYNIDQAAIPTLLEAFTLEKKAKSFGNARTVRNAVDMIMDFYADRSIREHTDTKVIMNADILEYYNNRKRNLQHEVKNASAANQVDEQIIRLAELKPRVKLGSDNPENDLNNLVGLNTFKDEIIALKNQKEFYNKIEKQRILFLGDNGCGKSTLTKILTGYLYNLGYIEENKYLEIPAEFLKGSFVGHTAKRAEAIISYASGGVLFIKNYNVLCEGQDAFTSEAISAITHALTEENDVTIVIADKPSENINNIRDLFTLVYEFPKYNNDQLLEIFDSLIYEDNFTISDDARQKLYDYINSNNKLTIREIQQIYSNTVKTHINKYDGNEENKYHISMEDITLPKKIKINIGKI